MPLVGDGNIALDLKKPPRELAPIKKMEVYLRRILQPFNTSESLITQKIQGIQGIRSRRDYDILKELSGQYDSTYVDADEADALEESAVEHMKKKYVLNNIMNLISKIPDKQQKVLCIVYLATEAQLLTKNPEDFHLNEDFPTDNEYLLFDNKNINKGLRSIYEDVQKMASQLTAVKDEFKDSVDEDVANIVFSYDNKQFLEMSTSDFFKAVKRAIGNERYNTEVQRHISDFLKKYKRTVKANMKGNAKDYCKRLGIDPTQYTQENVLKAMKPIDELDIWS